MAIDFLFVILGNLNAHIKRKHTGEPKKRGRKPQKDTPVKKKVRTEEDVKLKVKGKRASRKKQKAEKNTDDLLKPSLNLSYSFQEHELDSTNCASPFLSSAFKLPGLSTPTISSFQVEKIEPEANTVLQGEIDAQDRANELTFSDIAREDEEDFTLMDISHIFNVAADEEVASSKSTNFLQQSKKDNLSQRTNTLSEVVQDEDENSILMDFCNILHASATPSNDTSSDQNDISSVPTNVIFSTFLSPTQQDIVEGGASSSDPHQQMSHSPLEAATISSELTNSSTYQSDLESTATTAQHVETITPAPAPDSLFISPIDQNEIEANDIETFNPWNQQITPQYIQNSPIIQFDASRAFPNQSIPQTPETAQIISPVLQSPTVNILQSPSLQLGNIVYQNEYCNINQHQLYSPDQHQVQSQLFLSPQMAVNLGIPVIRAVHQKLVSIPNNQPIMTGHVPAIVNNNLTQQQMVMLQSSPTANGYQLDTERQGQPFKVIVMPSQREDVIMRI